MIENGFFKKTDPTAKSIAGFPLPVGWWSRKMEYPWALTFNNTLGGYVANMGAGYTYRPLTDALATRAGLVYSVDSAAPLWDRKEHPTPENVAMVRADMSQQILKIPPQSLDRIFCISVLEDTPNRTVPIIKEFARLITFGGLIVLTFDVKYDESKPLAKWPGARLEDILEACDKHGLSFREDIHMDKEGALFNEEFNLAVFHCVVMKK
jgi:hypothetical protein